MTPLSYNYPFSSLLGPLKLLDSPPSFAIHLLRLNGPIHLLEFPPPHDIPTHHSSTFSLPDLTPTTYLNPPPCFAFGPPTLKNELPTYPNSENSHSTNLKDNTNSDILCYFAAQKGKNIIPNSSNENLYHSFNQIDIYILPNSNPENLQK